MAHESASSRASADGFVARVAALDGLALDAGVMTLSVVGLVGNLLDIRSHDSGTTFAEEGFLTVPHVIFYSAFAAIAILIGSVVVARRLEGRAWLAAVPTGYKLGVLGVLLFGLGGPSDAAWHATFTAESGVEALTSPTHLMLATGAVLFLSSPVRRAWTRADLEGPAQLPMVASAAFTYTGITIITLYGHPVFGDQWVREGTNVSLGVISVVLQAAILAGLVVVLLRRFDLVPGAFTLILALNGIAMGWIGESYALLPGIVLTGLVADGLVAWLEPGDPRPRALRAVAVAVPMLYYAAYFVSIEVTGGIAWVVHIWAGGVVLAGFAGLLVSLVAIPGSTVDGAGDRPAVD